MILRRIGGVLGRAARSLDTDLAYAVAAELHDAAPECLGHDLAHGVEEPARYILRIGWTSVDDHLQGFRGGPHFGPFLAAVRPCIATSRR